MVWTILPQIRDVDAGRCGSSFHVRQRPVQAMANKDSDKPERSRLVSDALEFDQIQSHDEAANPKQHPMPSATSLPHGGFKAGELLGGRYTVVEVLGRGKAGIVYKVLTAF